MKKIEITFNAFNTGEIVVNSVQYDSVCFDFDAENIFVTITRSYFNKKGVAKQISKKINLDNFYDKVSKYRVERLVRDFKYLQEEYKPEYFDAKSKARFSSTEIAIDGKVFAFANDNCEDDWYTIGKNGVFYVYFPLFDLRNVKTEIVKKLLK